MKATRCVWMLILLVPSWACAQAAPAADPCAMLHAAALPQGTIAGAQQVMPGGFTVPDAGPGGSLDPRVTRLFSQLPAFCRVQAVLSPVADSHIELEVWLPVQGWNGKFEGVGNGGLGGSINYTDMARALSAGYATASTDTGHRGVATDGSWALNHREKLIDYGYRAIHLTAVAARQLVAFFYRRPAAHSYFSSCSNGGREAMMEVQRYPTDYDGVIAGAPAMAEVHIAVAFQWTVEALEGAAYIPADRYPAIETAVLAACDRLDGVRDGVVDDPRRCRFNPQVLRCRGAPTSSCLTQPQIQALQKIYAGPHGRDGRSLYPGLVPGGESGPGGWSVWVSGSEPGRSADVAFLAGGRGWFSGPGGMDPLHAPLEARLRDTDAAYILEAVDPDLTGFRQHGGKLILFHGWSDPGLTPLATVEYFDRVQSRMGVPASGDFVRLYMVPGMQHCGGGPGTDEFGALPQPGMQPRDSLAAALERWVEQGVAPGAIVARRQDPSGAVVRSRPLCPYPQHAVYAGRGSTDAAESFSCKEP